MILTATMSMFENRRERSQHRRLRAVATPTIESETAVSDGDDGSAGWHVIDQTKPNMKKPD
jgi:hypothetical protein